MLLRDAEYNKITIAEEYNKNITILGRSGSGKSYMCQRFIGEMARKGARTIALDFSVSYREDQLIWKDNIASIIKPYEGEFYYYINVKGEDNFVYWVSTELCKAMGINSFRQRGAFRSFCETIYSEKGYICIEDILKCAEDTIEALIALKDDKEYIKIVDALIMRLDEYRNVQIRFSNKKKCNSFKGNIHIIQLDRYPMRIRVMLTKFFMAIVFMEKRNGIGEGLYDYICLDEIQNIISSESTSIEGENGELISLIRECRRFGLGTIISTQYLNGFNKSLKSLLMQSGTRLLFRPTDSDIRELATEIEHAHIKEWMDILLRLHRGEAILTGTYIVADRLKCTTPIVVTVEEE